MFSFTCDIVLSGGDIMRQFLILFFIYPRTYTFLTASLGVWYYDYKLKINCTVVADFKPKSAYLEFRDILRDGRPDRPITRGDGLIYVIFIERVLSGSFWGEFVQCVVKINATATLICALEITVNATEKRKCDSSTPSLISIDKSPHNPVLGSCPGMPDYPETLYLLSTNDTVTRDRYNNDHKKSNLALGAAILFSTLMIMLVLIVILHIIKYIRKRLTMRMARQRALDLFRRGVQYQRAEHDDNHIIYT
ncbi:GP119.1 [Caviid betaherpesvirus 2]|uniref:GP119.1 n=1 Tax=Guinea pig cytomegalovirus (strain 22122) TaxID=103920 RepID=E9RHB7_GPCMV|nr:GP119.1 [Caviid betaherpesvirus 2]AGE11581.1 GP119.1 [Caviid betaherpesvirus 2]AIL83969.1 GP119.1 [BAC cloning vector GPN13BACdenovo_preserved(MM)]BAJ78569.1 GP119.1 [Caviid betaherpesvirus 2]